MSDARADNAPLHGVVFAHGLMAAGLVDAVRTITGCSPELVQALSNVEGSPEVLRERLEELVEGKRVIVFTDVRASSCSTLAAAALREESVVAVVSGVNLPMLLDFVFRNDGDLDEIVERLVARGRDGIELTPTPA